MSKLLTLEQVNQLTHKEFQQLFKNVVELWPTAAEEVSAGLPYATVDELVGKFEEYLENIPASVKEQILYSHPDLAGQLAINAELTVESTNEQAAAGLNKLSEAYKRQLQGLNEKYKEKFGFPFVICVRETNKIERILEGIKDRLPNNKTIELKNGIAEVKKICKIRIADIVDISACE